MRFSSQSAVLSGYLWKSPVSKGKDRFRKGWKKRFFELRRKKLFYYKDPSDVSAKGEVELRNALLSIADEITKEEFTFKITEARQNTVYIRAASKDERDEWINLILDHGAVLQRPDGALSNRRRSLATNKLTIDSQLLESDSVSSHRSVHDVLFQPGALSELAKTEIAFGCSFTVLVPWHHRRSQLSPAVLAACPDRKSICICEEGEVVTEMQFRNIVSCQLLAASPDVPKPNDASHFHTVTIEQRDTTSTLSKELHMRSLSDANDLVALLQEIANRELGEIQLQNNLRPIHCGPLQLKRQDRANEWDEVYGVIDTQRLVVMKSIASEWPLSIISLRKVEFELPAYSEILIRGHNEEHQLRFQFDDECDLWLKRLQEGTRDLSNRLKSSFEMPELAADENGSKDSALDSFSPSTIVIAWGDGSWGQLGNRSKDSTSTPTMVKALRKKKVSQMSSSRWHSFSACVSGNGSIFSWGTSDTGALGLGADIRSSSAPMILELCNSSTSFDKVACGSDHVIALSRKGGIFAWGGNRRGQLGNGSRTDSWTPIPIDLPRTQKAMDVSAGAMHSLAVVGAAQDVYSWGAGDAFQLGNALTDDVLEPTISVASQLGAVTSVIGGARCSACITEDGSVYTWGSGIELGHGPDSDCETLPTLLSAFAQRDIRITQLSFGVRHAIAIDSEGLLYSWGAAFVNGCAEIKRVPGRLNIPGVFVSCAAGAEHSFVIDDNAAAFAFGFNRQAELGFGESSLKAAAVQVRVREHISVLQASAGLSCSFLIGSGSTQHEAVDATANEALFVKYLEKSSSQQREKQRVEMRIGSLLAEHQMGSHKENLAIPSKEDGDDENEEEEEEENGSERKDSKRSLKALGSDWRSAIDPDTGRSYYWNKKSRERRWELDAAL